MILNPAVRVLLVLAFLLLVVGIGLAARLQFSRFAPFSVARLAAVSLAIAVAAIGAASWATGFTPRDLAGRASSGNHAAKLRLEPRTATELKSIRVMPAAAARRYERETARADSANRRRG